MKTIISKESREDADARKSSAILKVTQRRLWIAFIVYTKSVFLSLLLWDV
jgi:hypothetical protein